jgi:hypothetical protein
MSGSKYIHNMRDLDTDFFKDFLSDSSVKKILFCGNWGDPIYAKDFLGLIKQIKKQNANCSVTIHTNGAFKATSWWKELVGILLDNDRLVFSIDGVPDNYTKYRKNSNWASVENAIKTVVDTNRELCKNISVEWKYIVFAYNETTIEEAYELSKKLGFSRFFLQEALVSEHLDLTPSRSFEQIRREFYERIG